MVQGSQSFARPFSALSTNPWHQALLKQHPLEAAPKQAMPIVADVAATIQPQAKTLVAAPKAVEEVAASINTVRQNGMIFEIGILFTLTHYVHIFQSVARGLFQSFRPLLILYVFSHILKAVFFVAGAPIWFSFYSIWMFEVGYGLFQCLLSLIFIGTFYGNLLFPRVRPTMTAMLRQQKEKLTRAARMVSEAM